MAKRSPLADAAADVWHALAAQSKRRAGLRAFRDLHGFHAIERRHLDFAAEREGREVHRDLAEQVLAVAAEELVLVHVNEHVEVPRRAAGGAGFAFALEAQLLPGRDSRPES